VRYFYGNVIYCGAAFIGSNFVLEWLAYFDNPIVNLDKLTYAGNLENLSSLQGNARNIPRLLYILPICG
jgi:dTDP-D-glucose 4,6-dehydratase